MHRRAHVAAVSRGLSAAAEMVRARGVRAARARGARRRQRRLGHRAARGDDPRLRRGPWAAPSRTRPPRRFRPRSRCWPVGCSCSISPCSWRCWRRAAVRGWRERRAGRIRIAYRGGRTLVVPPGYSVLETSRAAGVPHVSVCGGRGRCSTCRVRVWSGLDARAAAHAGRTRDPAPRRSARRGPARVSIAPDRRHRRGAARQARAARSRVWRSRSRRDARSSRRRCSSICAIPRGSPPGGCRSTRFSSSIAISRRPPGRFSPIAAISPASLATAS